MKKIITALVLTLTVTAPILYAAQSTSKDTRAFIQLNLKNRQKMVNLICTDIYTAKQPADVTLPPADKCPELMQPVIINTINYYSKTLPDKINQSFAIAFGETIATQSRLRYFTLYSLTSRATFLKQFNEKHSATVLCNKLINTKNKAYQQCITDIDTIMKTCLNNYIKHIPKQLNFKDRRTFTKLITNCNQQSYMKLIATDKK
jgi:hypothetical protein